MQPENTFNIPRPSFPNPVRRPVSDPSVGPFTTIEIPCEWLPWIRGALFQLVQQATWKGTPDEILTTQFQAAALIDLFSGIAPGDCGNPSGEAQIFGGEDGDDMGCPCWRVQDGMLQFFCCGQWQDVIAANGSGQPGAGSPTPPPGGGTSQYCFALGPRLTGYAPAVVNTGDQILIQNPQGAWNDGNSLFWYCPNGYQFILGNCDPLPVNLNGQLLITARYMSIIAKIGNIYVDVFNADAAGNPQPFTVPGGVINQQIEFLANFNPSSPALIPGGSVTFCAQITNNQSTPWRALLDFTLSDWGFAPDFLGTANPEAEYAPGVGFRQVTSPALHQDHIAIFKVGLPSTEYTHVEMVMDGVTVWVTPLFRLYSPSSGYTAFASDTANTADEIFSFSPFTDTGLRMQSCNDPEQSPVQVVTSVIKKLKLAGNGPNPFPGAPTW